MKKNKYLLLLSSIGVLILLIVASIQENFYKDWRLIQKASISDNGPWDVHLRQIVIPALQVTDRCVSRHIGMAPGEPKIHGPKVTLPHKKVVHEVSDFGCTVCHGGQGRATETNPAHGNVPFWPVPIIPSKFAYAGCGSCHTHLSVPDSNGLKEGEQLLARHDCYFCHRVDEKGGTLHPGSSENIDGGDLSRVGMTGFDKKWYHKHLKHADESSQSSPWRHSFGKIPQTELKQINDFLRTRVAAPSLIKAKALFHSLGCRGCHKVNGVGGDDGPELSRVGEKDPGRLNYDGISGEHTLDNWLREHFRNPAKVVINSQMPQLGLSEEEINLLTFYMFSLRGGAFSPSYWPKDRIRVEKFGEREFSSQGSTLYSTFCAACHGEGGRGLSFPGMQVFPAIGNSDFLAAASDEFILYTINNGRPGRKMPPWGIKDGGLRKSEIEEILKFLRRGKPQTKAGEKPLAERLNTNSDEGSRLYQALCSGCHGQKGEGGQGPALNNKVFIVSADEGYLIETIKKGRAGTIMRGFQLPSPVRPVLSDDQIGSIATFIKSWQEK